MSHHDHPNPASGKEQAEGSRENVNVANERRRETHGSPGASSGQANHPGTITNRPAEEERNEEVPPRGQTKGDSHA
jgi:hypothetical protein